MICTWGVASCHNTASHEHLWCARCGRNAVNTFTGEQFCESCIDRCHEATELGHTCAVCNAPPIERRG